MLWLQRLTQSGGQAETIQADLTQPQQVSRCFAQIKERHGRLDVAINNAGVYMANALIVEMDPAEWQKLMDADLNSAFLCVQAEAKIMSTQEQGGVIVNISSVELYVPGERT